MDPHIPSAEEILQERAYIATWPSVEGRLERVNIRQDLHVARGVTWYSVEPEYRYTVDGREYQGTRLRIPSQYLRDTSPATLEEQLYHSFILPSRIVKREEADDGPLFRSRRLTLTLTNQVVRVYYDPKNPHASVLDRTDYDPPSRWKDWLSAVPFVFLGMIIMTVSLLRWRQISSAAEGKGFRAGEADSSYPAALRACLPGGEKKTLF